MSNEGIAPTLLLAMPQLDDPNFHRAVVLLCRHSSEGALGFIVNRPMETLASSVVSFDPALTSDSNLTVWEGGPVSQEKGWLLGRSLGDDDEALLICEGLHMSNSQGLLRRLVEGKEQDGDPTRCRLMLGYSGWGPGQLDGEIAACAWLIVPLDLGLVFETPAEDLWERAIRSLGVDPAAIAPAYGIH